MKTENKNIISVVGTISGFVLAFIFIFTEALAFNVTVESSHARNIINNSLINDPQFSDFPSIKGGWIRIVWNVSEGKINDYTWNITLDNTTYSERTGYRQSFYFNTHVSGNMKNRTIWGIYTISENISNDKIYNLTFRVTNATNDIVNVTLTQIMKIEPYVNLHKIVNINASNFYIFDNIYNKTNVSTVIKMKDDYVEFGVTGNMDFVLFNKSVSFGNVSSQFFGKTVLIESADEFAPNNIESNMSWAIKKIHYTDQEVQGAGLIESSLKMVSFNQTTNSWQIEPTSTVDVNGNFVRVNVTHLSAYGIIGDPIPPQTPPYSYPTPSYSTPSSSGSSGSSGSSDFGNIYVYESPKPKFNMTELNEVYQKWTREFAEDEDKKHLEEIEKENEKIKNKTHSNIIEVSMHTGGDLISQLVWLFKTMLGLV